jgi:hypothetical protein
MSDDNNPPRRSHGPSWLIFFPRRPCARRAKYSYPARDYLAPPAKPVLTVPALCGSPFGRRACLSKRLAVDRRLIEGERRR